MIKGWSLRSDFSGGSVRRHSRSVAAVLSVPLSIYAMSNWLDGYAYWIGLGWILFATPPLLILVVATLTVSAGVAHGDDQSCGNVEV